MHTALVAEVVRPLSLACLLMAPLAAHGQDYSTAAPAPPGYPAIEATDQGWEYGTAQWWYHADQGTAFIPYPWFLALEQAAGEELFSAPGNLARFGFLPNVPNEYNPDGLPVGFSRTTPDFPKSQWKCWGGEWLGVTCAGCHTGQINYRGTQIRIEGGPAQNDIETFRDQLALVLAANFGSIGKYQRFATRVAQRQGAPDPELRDKFQCYLAEAARRGAVEDAGLAQADEIPTRAGFGRLDALGRGGNFLFAETPGRHDNYKPTTAPVSFPFLWDTPFFDWVLYNNTVTTPLPRNIVEALGVGAPIDLATRDEPVIDHRSTSTA